MSQKHSSHQSLLNHFNRKEAKDRPKKAAQNPKENCTTTTTYTTQEKEEHDTRSIMTDSATSMTLEEARDEIKQCEEEIQSIKTALRGIASGSSLSEANSLQIEFTKVRSFWGQNIDCGLSDAIPIRIFRLQLTVVLLIVDWAVLNMTSSTNFSLFFE